MQKTRFAEFIDHLSPRETLRRLRETQIEQAKPDTALTRQQLRVAVSGTSGTSLFSLLIGL
ncbi:MAG: hypothetical protein ABI859_00130 [Pseudomonadota bacterium]